MDTCLARAHGLPGNVRLHKPSMNVCTAKSYGVIVWQLLTGFKPQHEQYCHPRCDALLPMPLVLLPIILQLAAGNYLVQVERVQTLLHLCCLPGCLALLAPWSSPHTIHNTHYLSQGESRSTTPDASVTFSVTEHISYMWCTACSVCYNCIMLKFICTA